MSLSIRINDTNAAPWVIEEIKKLEQRINDLESILRSTERIAHERDALAALCQEAATVLERTAKDSK